MRVGNTHLALFVGVSLLALSVRPATGQHDLGPEELVQANGVDIEVPGYSVPSFTYWNGDALKDLIVGEGSGIFPDARVRVYLNVGTVGTPQFADFFYAQSEGGDLVVSGSG